MSKLIIKFNNVRQEIDRVFSALADLDFYKKNNYQIGLPVGIENLSEKEIKKIITAEYDPAKYQEKIKTLSSDWNKMEADFFAKAEKILKLKPLSRYECFITKYGTGGSYNPPNQIIMNINSQNFGIYTIPHEIIHLLIHDLIEKYKIDHWSKERLVDLYLFQILGFNKFQTIQDQDLVDRVDKAFKKFVYNGAKTVIKNIQKG